MAWISDNYGFDFEEEATYQRVSISQLSSELSQIIVMGTVIAKQDMRHISSRKQPGRERYVLNFTIRDSPSDTINATCWGEESAVSTLNAAFTIGDIVKIKNPQVTERQTESEDQKFRPTVNSKYQLNISPQYSEITLCLNEERRGYEKLLHCSMHHNSEILNLIDIIYNSQNAEGLSVNLLVAVRGISPIQTVKTKDGREVKKLQMTVFDQSHPIFNILIWEEETANFLSKYCSKRSVILISGIKVNYNNYMKEIIGTSGSATIFTPDPDIPDARVLYQYAMKVTLPDDAVQTENKYADSTITYKIEEILKLMNTSEIILSEIQGTLHAMITSFDIDGSNKISSLRCPGCIQLLLKQDDKCINGACEIGSGMKNSPAEEMFDIPLSLADNTGCINRCLLLGQTAQHFLGLSVQEFSRLSDDDKTNLKWNYLFERVTLQFKVTPSTTGNGRYNFRISSCKKCD